MLGGLALLAASACETPFFAPAPRLRPASVPVVGIRTTGGSEMGVPTGDGVLFLGRTAQKGPAKVLYFIGETPVVEAGNVRPVGGSLFGVELEVDIPTVPISLDPLQPGDQLELVGLDGDRVFHRDVSVPRNAAVSGTVVSWPEGMDLKPEHVGAGVFRVTAAGRALVGLVKATARVQGGQGFLVLAGLPEIRQAMFTPETAVPQREVIYRADGTRTIRVKH